MNEQKTKKKKIRGPLLARGTKAVGIGNQVLFNGLIGDAFSYQALLISVEQGPTLVVRSRVGNPCIPELEIRPYRKSVSFSSLGVKVQRIKKQRVPRLSENMKMSVLEIREKRSLRKVAFRCNTVQCANREFEKPESSKCRFRSRCKK